MALYTILLYAQEAIWCMGWAWALAHRDWGIGWVVGPGQADDAWANRVRTRPDSGRPKQKCLHFFPQITPLPLPPTKFYAP